MTPSRVAAHIHPAALSALLAHDPSGRPYSVVASAAGFTPANVREFQTGVRSGARAETRSRLAAEMGVPAGAITCWCDRPDGRCRSLQENDVV
jgi:hypothetical protein